MYCPQCNAEYRDGIYDCPDCEVALVSEPPVVSHPDPKLVNIFETSDVALLPVVTSVLDSADIVYMVQGAEALSLWPVGGYGAGMTRHGQGLSVNIFVEEARAEDARALLQPMTSGEAQPDDSSSAESDDEGEPDTGGEG